MTRHLQFLSFSLLFAWLAWLNPSAAIAAEYTAGDRIFISLPEKEAFNRFFAINENGIVTLPEIGDIAVTGVPVETAIDSIRNKLSPLTTQKQSLQIWSESDLVNVTVLGDIAAPGIVRAPPQSTLQQMLRQINSDVVGYLDSTYRIVRRGNRLAINADGADQFLLQGNDIVIVVRGVEKKPLPKPKVKPKPKTVEKSEVISATKSEKVEPVPTPQSSEQGETDNEKTNYETLTILQAGDQIYIGLPDEEFFNTEFEIDRNGVVQLPEIGAVTLAGLSLADARGTLFKAFSQVFLGLDRLVISLKERRILLTVLGFVESPGEVELPINGNVQMAIDAAGGLIDGAQMDRLQLRRGEDVTVFDYKGYLDSGDLSILPEIGTLDVLFVPSSPKLSSVHGETMEDGSSGGIEEKGFKVLGEVKNPGSYSYKEEMSVVDLITISGGVTRYANVEQIRVITGNEPVLFNLKQYLDSGDSSSLPELTQDSTVFVPKQSDAIRSGTNVVYIIGQANKPGAYETSNNVNFLDVLANAGGPNRFAELRQVRILRSDGSVDPVDLNAYTEGKLEKLPKLGVGDAIFIPEKGGDGTEKSWLKLPTERAIKIIGAVKKPGRYEWSDEVDLMDLMGNAGGPSQKADLAHIKILTTTADGSYQSYEFDMDKLMKKGGDISQLPKLKAGDTITVPQLAESPTDNKGSWIRQSPDRSVYVMGDVVAPGRYAFSDEMDFLDVLSAAEGPGTDADLRNIVINHRAEKAPRVTHFNMTLYFETGDETLLPTIQAGDNIYVPSRKGNWLDQKKEDTVRILGAVKTSGRYQFNRDMTILDVLAEAGGPTKTAYIEKIIIVNVSCCENKAYTFDLMDFMKDPDVSRLPVLRPGDTVFVPDNTNSRWAVVMENIKDVLSIISLIALSKSL